MQHRVTGSLCEESPPLAQRQTYLPIDVQHSNERVLLDSRMQSLIDVAHDPAKELGVDVFGQRISGVCGLQLGNGLDVRLRGSGQLSMAEPVAHLLIFHTHEVTEDAERFMLGLLKQKGQIKEELSGNGSKEVTNETISSLKYQDHSSLINDDNHNLHLN